MLYFAMPAISGCSPCLFSVYAHLRKPYHCHLHILMIRFALHRVFALCRVFASRPGPFSCLLCLFSSCIGLLGRVQCNHCCLSVNCKFYAHVQLYLLAWCLLRYQRAF